MNKHCITFDKPDRSGKKSVKVKKWMVREIQLITYAWVVLYPQSILIRTNFNYLPV